MQKPWLFTEDLKGAKSCTYTCADPTVLISAASTSSSGSDIGGILQTSIQPIKLV